MIGSRGAVAVWLTGALLACGDDAESGPRPLGEGCVITTDCVAGLVCEFNRCQQPCAADSECTGAARCVRPLRPDGSRVCQLPEDTACTVATECRGAQVCGVGECRDRCVADGDCTTGQICTNQGQCASTDPNKDRVDANGNLLPDGSGGALLDANMSTPDAAPDAR